MYQQNVYLYSKLRCNIGMYLTQPLALTREKWECTSHLKVRGEDSRIRKQIRARKKKKLCYSSCRAYAVYTNGLLAGCSLCSTPFPQWECFLPAAEPGCANSGDIQVWGPEPLPSSQVGGASTIWGWQQDEPLEEKKEHLYNPWGYVLGAGCNCFPHFLRLVKLIHYQRQAVMPWAWQWACFLWAFWHFLLCNSKQKPIKPVIKWCIRREKAFWGHRHSLTWLKVSCLRCLPKLWQTLFLLGQSDCCI